MKKIFSFLFLFILFLPLITGAKGLVPCGGPDENPCTACDVVVMIEKILHFALDSGVIIIVGAIIWGGITWITSLGDSKKIEKGKNIIQSAIIGLIIVLGSYIIINTTFWLIAHLGGDNYVDKWFQIDCTTPVTTPNNDNNVNNNGGNGGIEGSITGKVNWCSDMEGYACVAKMEGFARWNPNCSPASVVLTDPNITHCPENTICCIPADSSKIVAEPKNPEPPNLGGPCEGGALMVSCPNLSECVPRPKCELEQHPERQPYRCVFADPTHPPMRCPPCPHQCDNDDDCNTK